MIKGEIIAPGSVIFLIIRDEEGVEYFAPFAGFRRPVRTDKGVEFAIPADQAGGFAVGQKVLIIEHRHPTLANRAEAKAAGESPPLSEAEEWALSDEFEAVF